MARRRRKARNPETPWLKYALIAGGCYAVYRLLKSNGMLGENGDDYNKSLVEAFKPDPIVEKTKLVVHVLPDSAQKALKTVEVRTQYAKEIISTLDPRVINRDYEKQTQQLEALRQKMNSARKLATQGGKPIYQAKLSEATAAWQEKSKSLAATKKTLEEYGKNIASVRSSEKDLAREIAKVSPQVKNVPEELQQALEDCLSSASLTVSGDK